MGASNQLLTSREFADRSGLPLPKVTKLLRDGRIKGQKEAGKWMIPESEREPAAASGPPPQPTKPQESAAAATAPSAPAVRPGQALSVAEFSARTYLTEYGVRDFLKKGILKGTQDEDSEWRIDHANLEDPRFKDLVR
ncbi:MAG: helix-turn-helix domain-containing protein [Desulfosarcina sp.]|nr:helix-turn-helix domain-containing protein [Desulfobacterales bacterium]